MDTEPIELLRAKSRLSLARMYLVDLEKGYNFGNMVDGRGAGFNCSKSLWIDRIIRICTDASPLLADDVAIVMARLKAACPEVIISGEEVKNDSAISERKP